MANGAMRPRTVAGSLSARRPKRRSTGPETGASGAARKSARTAAPPSLWAASRSTSRRIARLLPVCRRSIGSTHSLRPREIGQPDAALEECRKTNGRNATPHEVAANRGDGNQAHRCDVPPGGKTGSAPIFPHKKHTADDPVHSEAHLDGEDQPLYKAGPTL